MTGPGKIEVERRLDGPDVVVAVLYNFSTDSAELKTEHRTFLTRRVVPLLPDPYTHVFLTGAASRIGATTYNAELSHQRTDSVAEFLKRCGAADYQLHRAGIGESASFGPDANNERHRAVVVYAIRKRKKRKGVVRPPKKVEKRGFREYPQYVAPEGPQFQLAVRTYIPFKSFLGAEGDGRGFSMSPRDTYRTGMFLVFDLGRGRIAQPLVGNSTGSRWDRRDASIYAEVTADLLEWKGDNGRIYLSAHMEGSDPLLHVPVTPNVDTDIRFTAFLRDGDLYVAGQVIGDAFPNTEVFLRDHVGQGYPLLHFATGYEWGGAFALYGDGYRDLGRFQLGIQLDEQNRFLGSRDWRQ